MHFKYQILVAKMYTIHVHVSIWSPDSCSSLVETVVCGNAQCNFLTILDLHRCCYTRDACYPRVRECVSHSRNVGIHSMSRPTIGLNIITN